MHWLTFFYRHTHPIYFSIEKLFHSVAEKIADEPNTDFQVKEINLPFTSSLTTIRKNISFVKRSQSGINHITGDAQYAILGCSRKNINILTVHDCVLLHHYSKLNLRFWIIRWLWYSWPVRRADAVTVISENTKKDILQFTNCPAGKIRVIPNFIDPLFVARPRTFRKENPVLLFIGTAPNKNLGLCINAITGLPVELLIIGYINDAQTDCLKINGITYRVKNNLTNEQMRDAYAEADVLLFPSTLEGFGLPIIEAQATGRPVITSQLEPMISVAGGSACCVDPYSAESIRSGIQKVIQDDHYRNDLIQLGFKNIERYRLEKVVQQYSDLYKEMIKAKEY